MRAHSSDSLLPKHTLENLYISLGLGALHPTRGMEKKEKKPNKNYLPFTKNDLSLPSFLLDSQF